MTEIKYEAIVAAVSEEKFNDAFIDSGATHHLFHGKSSVTSNENIPADSVHAAFSTLRLI